MFPGLSPNHLRTDFDMYRLSMAKLCPLESPGKESQKENSISELSWHYVMEAYAGRSLICIHHIKAHLLEICFYYCVLGTVTIISYPPHLLP